MPVNPSQAPFQLHRIGANVFAMISLHAVGEYGHIIQSKHPVPASTPNENSKEPDEAILITIHVGFGPAESKQPAFNVPTELSGPGLVEGFENEPVVSSITLPTPFGVI
jgi:hypothetical protein